MRPIVNVPASSERVRYVLYYFDTTQDTKRLDKTNVHVPNLVCLQQFCSKSDKERDCVECSKGKHSSWEDTVGDMLSYMCVIPDFG